MWGIPKFQRHEAPSKKRKHIILPWIANPTKGAQDDILCFQQRHEANSLELFFDLFFVANLATFTAYHSVTDHAELLAYVGFFGIVWGTWFAITLFDVRFAIDSVYERACKVLQFVVFVGFALVGSQFQPGGDEKDDNNANFRTLSVLLAMSRALLSAQYLIVLIFCAKAKYNKLILPLGLCSFFYLLTTGAFALMTLAFKDKVPYHNGIYSLWYIAIFLETALVLAVSSIWRMLSFKRTHLVERMGLLTLIVIGEGAIGITKTVSAMMSKKGPDSEGCALIFTIILVLIFLWMMYFDNAPHGHYGTIRQQIWALLHFPLHISIVGLVEGSQQLTRARYVIRNLRDFSYEVRVFCHGYNYDGSDLDKKLRELIYKFQIDKKAEAALQLPKIYDDITNITSTKGVCSAANTMTNDFPKAIEGFLEDIGGAMYAGMGTKIPKGERAADIAGEAWHITYNYYWGAFTVLLLTNILLLYLVRKAKVDFFDWLSMLIRLIALGLSIVLLVLGIVSDEFYSLYIVSPAMVPTAALILFVIVSIDALGRSIANWRLHRSGAQFIDLAAEDGHHGGHEHGEGHGHDDKAAHGAHGTTPPNEKSVTAHTSLYDNPAGYTPASPSPVPEYTSPQHSRHQSYVGSPPPPLAGHTPTVGGYTAGTTTGYFPPQGAQ